MHVKRHAHQRGANLVEAALVIPLLLIILIGAVDFGRAYFTYITIINAAREGAHWGVLHPPPTGDVCGKALAETQDLAGLGLTPTCAYSCPAGACTSGNPLEVTVSVDPFPMIFGGIVGLPTIPIIYTVTFPIRGV